MSTSRVAPTPTKLVKVPLAEIELTDRSTQSRVRMFEHRIVEYAEALQRGMDLFNVLDPVRLFYDGSKYWIGDGWHRVSAALRVNRSTISALVTAGGKDDAVYVAVGANTRHGIQRTREDKQRAVRLALQHPRLRRLTDRSIAKHVDVSHTFVANVRREMSGNVATAGGKSAPRAPQRPETPRIEQDPIDAKAVAIIETLHSLYNDGVITDLGELHGAPLSDERLEELGEIAARLVDELTPFVITKDDVVNDDEITGGA